MAAPSLSPPSRRLVALGLLASVSPALAAPASPGERLAAAARRQIGVTRTYDPAYRRIGYPHGDVPRATGVCADVVVRAARDALGLDLQRLVHEDMTHAFAAYPSRRAWGLAGPDANIDHRRVLNLEVFWSRQGAKLWQAPSATSGSGFPGRLEPGDFLTWRLPGGPHVGVVVSGGVFPRIVHNIGDGAREAFLAEMMFGHAYGRYRWPT